MVAVPELMAPNARAAGLLMIDEIRYLGETLKSPAGPFVVVLGGAKVSDKLKTINRVLEIADQILIGGAMAYTFLKVIGRRVGQSLVEDRCIDDARSIIGRAAALKADLFLPNDHVCAREISEQSPVEVFTDHIEDPWMGLDIGPKTQERYAAHLAKAKTIVWNGPVGVFETSPFNVGTDVIAQAIAKATRNGATSIIGGGDTAAAVHTMGLGNTFSHVSTGGGASLVMLEGGPMPGIDILTDA
jgi:phosphoglycerate kinase